ncbi:hypothetical protein U2181_15235, partial [Listeria monocytogenes]|uniref:hypothetical protein n=1 Tax=Listeria monocytogenes TaxID=1639 RepID=UPI002FDC1824
THNVIIIDIQKNNSLLSFCNYITSSLIAEEPLTYAQRLIATPSAISNKCTAIAEVTLLLRRFSMHSNDN